MFPLYYTVIKRSHTVKRNSKSLLVLTMVALIALWSGLSWAAGLERHKTTASSINFFGLDLYQLLKLKHKNLFFSPYSISVALSMACAGAQGETRNQIHQVLHSKSDNECLASDFPTLSNIIKDSNLDGSGEMYLANGIWLQKGFNFNQDYLSSMENNFGVHPSELDFMRDPKLAGKEINKWVTLQTQNKISELITSEAIGPATSLVLASAIYLKFKWDTEFQKELTMEAPFKSLDKKKTAVPMMHQTGTFAYLEDVGFQAIEMPYKGGKLSMIVILPADNVDLNVFENKFSDIKIAGWMGMMKKTKVEVYFPKFKRNAPVYQLVSALKPLGMTDAFSKLADFSGMSSAKGFSVSSIMHKAFIEVDEEGTEAPSVTAIGEKAASIETPIPVFRADRPFTFFIRHNPTNTILFVGRFVSP